MKLPHGMKQRSWARDSETLVWFCERAETEWSLGFLHTPDDLRLNRRGQPKGFFRGEGNLFDGDRPVMIVRHAAAFGWSGEWLVRDYRLRLDEGVFRTSDDAIDYARQQILVLDALVRLKA